MWFITSDTGQSVETHIQPTHTFIVVVPADIRKTIKQYAQCWICRDLPKTIEGGMPITLISNSVKRRLV